MISKLLKNLLALLLMMFTSSAFANNYKILAPNCLITKLKGHYESLAKQDNLLLITVDEDGFNQLIFAKTHQKTPCGGFINVTEVPQQKNAKYILNKFSLKPIKKLKITLKKTRFILR